MNSRISRPLLVFAVSGALVAGGGLVANPASADPGQPGVTHRLPSADASLVDGLTPGAKTVAELAPESATAADTTSKPVTAKSTPSARSLAAADTAPVGTFTLNTSALWIGQSITLTQGAVTDDTTPSDQIIRKVAWGDGTSSDLAPDVATYTHKYTTNKAYHITVTYTDAAGISST